MVPILKNFAFTYLGEAMDNTQTTLRVKTGTGGSNFLEPLDSEHYGLVLVARSRGLVDLVQGELIRLDTIDGGDDDLYNVTRNFDSRGARAHVAGELVLANIFAEHFTSVYTDNSQVRKFIALAFGGETGIIRTTGDDLKVAPHGGDMKIIVNTGNCIIENELVTLDATYTSGVISQTSAGKLRKDTIEITSLGNIVILTGNEFVSSPVAPTVDAHAIKLGELLINDTITVITTGDITDARNFY